jgi:formate dehydrogenase gamma subunit
MTFSRGSRDEGNLDVTFYPGLCNHCGDHPCTEDCPTGATYQDSQGIIVVDANVCIGCGNCVPKCPYGARHADPRKGIVEKCNFCAPYLHHGEEPACVATCLAECRHFGDIDDPESSLSRLIRERKAKPLVTNEIDVDPHVFYAPDELRLQVLSQSVVQPYRSTLFTHAYREVTRPLARWAVAPMVLATGAAGIGINLLKILRERRQDPEPSDAPVATPQGHGDGLVRETLPRHSAGMRFLHWFNLLSWFLLLSTGTALMATEQFALFGTRPASWIAERVGGKPNLIWFHAAWGLAWSLIIVPLFLYLKKGGWEAIREVWPSYDDVKWMVLKPLVMVGLKPESELPPQDKYNFGQKLFAISALTGTATIVATGTIMTFHLGSANVLLVAILVHKIAVMLALVGIAVHVTMAAILVDERPALWAMVMGEIDREHARRHSSKWIQEMEQQGETTEHHTHPTHHTGASR